MFDGIVRSKILQALPGRKPRGAFSFPPAMSRSTALESHMYGDPMEVYAAKQAREKRQAQQEYKRPTLTLRSKKTGGEWSEARKAAESLFDLPIPAADHS
jgi:hypothetical protein